MKCLYHSDQDGECSGFWVKYFEKNGELSYDDFILAKYEMELPLNKIKKDEKVIIVDFSFEPDEMKELMKKTENIVWIDHHKTAIDKYKDFPFDFPGIRMVGYGACYLTWLYFSRNFKPAMTAKEIERVYQEECPRFTRLISDRDVWKHEFKESSTFYLGLQAENTHPTSKIWMSMNFSNSEVNDIIDDGQVIEKYRDNQANSYVQQWSKEYKWLGHKCLMMNLGPSGSEMFGDVSKTDEYDILVPFAMDMKSDMWRVSLYAGHNKKKIDVGEIAKKFGGGGHAGASGFQCKKLPWLE